ncbi:GtrA family protein [Xanthomonas maliensis]|uniref:GtrA family protein n=1 Tax=Xanthomonas maliensis TaxID=1321368 RepID=UPI0012647892|nr:GtrA family protein [Xanthomonas maliensis]KAB7763451.1 hypothetical protein CKY51_19830 [Xanthomonas maliensis]
MFASTKVAIKYAIFALIATVANIGAQDMLVRAYAGSFAIPVSVIIGTGVGLVVKYLLDKRYIFRFIAKNTVHDAQTFALYAIMGVVTTAIFWGIEFGFQQVFGTREMRYLGGVIGLAVGYITKYNLDKRYVFREASQ